MDPQSLQVHKDNNFELFQLLHPTRNPFLLACLLFLQYALVPRLSRQQDKIGGRYRRLIVSGERSEKGKEDKGGSRMRWRESGASNRGEGQVIMRMRILTY